MAASFKYDDFTPVTSRKKKKKNLKARPPLLTLVQSAAEDLRKDNWNAICQRLLQDHLDTLPVRPSKIICLGLGSPSSSANSRAQLAFLLEVCKSTGIEHAQVALYDPVFSEEDKALFGQLGLTDKQDGRHPLDAPTILWMPHCDLDLYESVLATNWSHDQLTYMTLIANRLGDYVERSVGNAAIQPKR
ncbi:SRR1-domain-containing protein [Mycena amicta]|nr:SRR1-domain-containing protein [Mycena amicta]